MWRLWLIRVACEQVNLRATERELSSLGGERLKIQRKVGCGFSWHKGCRVFLFR
ncbi:hypothetical protein NC651_036945 [Populus alba x Populus x berolinensis]|nr:hypothetical protein NC651_036945 [Populus alba x Populus x berolinensis]